MNREPDHQQPVQKAIRARSLFVSLWGDVLAPHGEEFWLSGIIALAAALGINERLVRTTLFRLAEDDWLTSARVGRRSRYRLTDHGLRRVGLASQRIYGARLAPWSGHWTLVLQTPGISAARRHTLEQDLQWQGFAPFAPGLFAQPERDLAALAATLRSTDTDDAVVVFRASAPATGSLPLAQVVRRAYGLDQIALRYREFLDHFSVELDRLSQINDAQAFALRVGLIHDFRRVLLLDPELPHALLPEDWPGHRAYQLARIIYRRLEQQSERFVATHLGQDANSKASAEILRQRLPVHRPDNHATAHCED